VRRASRDTNMDVKEAIEVCRKNPEQLRELNPPLFEAVIAELLAGFGWEVSVTPATRDGGYDILGVTTDDSGLRTSWIIECKRYAADNKVGVQIARQVTGVKGPMRYRASEGKGAGFCFLFHLFPLTSYADGSFSTRTRESTSRKSCVHIIFRTSRTGPILKLLSSKCRKWCKRSKALHRTRTGPILKLLSSKCRKWCKRSKALHRQGLREMPNRRRPPTCCCKSVLPPLRRYGQRFSICVNGFRP
jgi:hypothetical protein